MLGAIATTNTAAVTAGSGYGIKDLVPPEPSTKLMTEDQVQAAAGAASASATLGGSDTWGAVLAAFKTATGGGDTQPQITSINPTAGLVGTSVTITGTNFGTTQGTSTVTFSGTAATPTSWSATSIVTPVPSGATTGNVMVSVGGVASNGLAFTVASAPGLITLTQHSSIDAGTTTSLSLAFVSANTAGNWIAVAVRGGMSSSQIFTVTDSNGNAYKKAGQVGFTSSAVTLAIYYAENIKGGANTVTVSDTVSGPLRVAILEYSGVAASSSLDKVAVATGTSTLPNSGSLNATAGGDLLLGAIATTNTAAVTAGSGYGIKDLVPPEPSTKLMTEDQVQAAAGAASASATLGGSDTWGAVLAAFKTAAGGGGTRPQIMSLNLSSAPVGASVTITGTNFGTTQGTSTVTFSGTPATPTSWSATSIVTPVPSGATTGNVAVAVSGVASNGMAFTVATVPNITTQPASQTITAGQTATFSVVAAGTAPLSYQWKQNGTAISGATASSYTTPAETTSASGAQFTVVVSNSAGSVTSNAATLTVNAAAVAPSITTQPASQTITAGQTATFSVTATGTAPLSYQWRQNGTAISGATASSYTTPAETTSANGAQFTVVVTNSAGSVTSNAATLTVNAAAPGALTPSTTSLSFNNVNVGSNGSLSVTFTNSGSSNITVSNVSMSGAGFTAGGVSNGQIITPGQVVTMTVTFAPAATGSVTGSVTVASNASNSPVSISLSGTGQIGSTNTSGWTYIQDSITTGGGTCLAGSSSCTIGVSLMFPTTAGSVWLVRTHTGNNVQIASVTGGGGTWTHCPSCAVFNSTLNQSIDASYNLSGGAGTTAVTVTLAAPASGFFQVNFIELLPPSGSTASFDAAAATSSNSCSTCTGAGLSLSGTDAVFQTQAGNGVSGWNGWSSPYITDGRGNGIGLNVTSGAAPTVKMNSSIGGLFMAIAFKSSAGSFTPPAQQFSAVNFTSPAAGANCTPSCTLTIPFTGSGHLLYLEVGDINNAHIVSISGGGTWVIPGGSNSCAIVLSPNQALSCGYILSSTAGATSLNLTMSGSGAIAYAVWEIATTSGSFALDTQGSTQNPATGFNPRGQALTLTGTNDVIFQSIFAPGGTSSVTLYPMGYINGQGQLFFNNQAGLAALLNTTNGAAPEWATENVPTTVFGVAFKATAATPAAPATLNSSSSTLAFGNITVGTSANLSATLTNSGNSSVTLSAVSISGPGFNASGISVGNKSYRQVMRPL